MSDFGDAEWKQMICIEASNVAGFAVALLPGAAAHDEDDAAGRPLFKAPGPEPLLFLNRRMPGVRAKSNNWRRRPPIGIGAGPTRHFARDCRTIVRRVSVCQVGVRDPLRGEMRWREAPRKPDGNSCERVSPPADSAWRFRHLPIRGSTKNGRHRLRALRARRAVQSALQQRYDAYPDVRQSLQFAAGDGHTSLAECAVYARDARSLGR